MSERLSITLETIGDEPPAELRFRRVLKWLRRSHGLRCVDFQGDGHGAIRTDATQRGVSPDPTRGSSTSPQ